MDADGFTIVTGGKSRRRRRRGASKDTRSQNKDDGAVHYQKQQGGGLDVLGVPSMRKDLWIRRHDKFKRQIVRTELFAAVLREAMRFQPQTIVCYGLGALSIPRCGLQLALVCCLCEALASPSAPEEGTAGSVRVLSFDPIHGSADEELLGLCDITPLAESVLGKDVPSESRSLFFMPHNERWMYADVVAARDGSLDRTLITGNSFKEYVVLDAKQQDNITKLIHESRVEETTLSLTVDEQDCDIDPTTMFDAFNNTRVVRVLPKQPSH